MRFNTIGVSDGISMGTEGMSYSLQSRDLIADSIETVMGAQWYDANVSLPGCDKNMPGCVMAMGAAEPALAHGLRRHDPRRARPQRRRRSTSSPRSSATASSSPARIDEPARADIVRHACPGAGACGGMYTANTMASAIEALGMALPYSSSTPAEDPAQARRVRRRRRGDPPPARARPQARATS